MTRALRNNKKSPRFETYQTRLADIQARLAAGGDERPPTLENKQCIRCATSSYEVEVFHPDAPSVRRLVNTQVRSEHQEMFYCFRSCGAAWGNVTSDQDILDMAEHLRFCTRCTGIYTRMDPIDDERFEAVKKDCTAVRVTYDNDRAPDGKIVTMPEYLAPGDPLPVFSTFDELDANAD
ncbi:uncharacterized protein FTOL_09023 [Fusarium torulosum]|uniref:Uncharacterized protein n=1 Tax=Fusarium torulosum TaxID=33205 RepID=A0AAE8SKQ1_9HYPO|nr:uncharacterized protein FTOL_09023 [Fusarium torulosum]